MVLMSAAMTKNKILEKNLQKIRKKNPQMKKRKKLRYELVKLEKGQQGGADPDDSMERLPWLFGTKAGNVGPEVTVVGVVIGRGGIWKGFDRNLIGIRISREFDRKVNVLLIKLNVLLNVLLNIRNSL
jgi:hypothetical protein